MERNTILRARASSVEGIVEKRYDGRIGPGEGSFNSTGGAARLTWRRAPAEALLLMMRLSKGSMPLQTA
jgi:hypothetical protein